MSNMTEQHCLFAALFGSTKHDAAKAFYGDRFDSILAYEKLQREQDQLLRARRADMIDDCYSQVLEIN